MAGTTRINPVTARLTMKSNLLAGRSVWYLAFATGLVGLALYIWASSHHASLAILDSILLTTAFLLFLCPAFIAPCVTLWMVHEAQSEQYQLLYLSEMSDAKLVRGYVRAILYKCRALFLILIILVPTLLLLWIQANQLIVEKSVPLEVPCALAESGVDYPCRRPSPQDPYRVAQVNRVAAGQLPEWILIIGTAAISQIGMNLAAIVMGVAFALKSRGNVTPIISVLISWLVMCCLVTLTGYLLWSLREFDQAAIQTLIFHLYYPSQAGQLLILSTVLAVIPYIVAMVMAILARRWVRQPRDY